MTQLDRRSLTRAAVWSAPAIVLASAVPARAASVDPGAVDVGAYSLSGSCGVLGIQGPGFLLTAGPSVPLPVGTTVLVVATGTTSAGTFSVSGGTASVTTLSPTSRQITLTAALPAGATITFRTTLSITTSFTLNAVTTLPSGYVGTGSKAAGSVSSTMIVCSAT